MSTEKVKSCTAEKNRTRKRKRNEGGKNDAGKVFTGENKARKDTTEIKPRGKWKGKSLKVEEALGCTNWR